MGLLLGPRISLRRQLYLNEVKAVGVGVMVQSAKYLANKYMDLSSDL